MKGFIFRIFVIAAIFFSGCKPAEKVAPPLPSRETFNIDLSYFSPPENETDNYARAFNTVAFWKILFEDSLVFYNDLYKKLDENNFKYQDENTWLIVTSLIKGDKTYDIKFFETVKDTVFTKLFISQDSTYENLPVFDGWFLPDSTNGFWQINKPDTGNTTLKYLKIDRNFLQNGQKTLKATYILTDENNGSYILYKDSTDSGFDAYIDVFEKITENHTFIQYNKTSLNGRVKDFAFFGDENWYCWDGLKNNTNCK